MEFAQSCDLLLVVGTTLQTTLPYLIVQTVVYDGKDVIEVNPEPVLSDYSTLEITESASSLDKVISLLEGR